MAGTVELLTRRFRGESVYLARRRNPAVTDYFATNVPAPGQHVETTDTQMQQPIGHCRQIRIVHLIPGQLPAVVAIDVAGLGLL